MAKLDIPNDLRIPTLRSNEPICKTEKRVENLASSFSDCELCCNM